MAGEHNDCHLGLTPEIVHDMIEDQGKRAEQLENIATSVSEIKGCLLGNGKDGLTIRTDRLEQKDKTRGKIFWAMFAIITALIVQTLTATYMGS